MDLRPISVVRSPATADVDEGGGKVAAEIHPHPELAAGLQGLAQLSHVLVLCDIHAAPVFYRTADLVRRPRGRVDLPEVGIFAQPAKHRPNPIGLTAAARLGVDGPAVRVHGSPVLDPKPCFPAFDRIQDAAVPEWVDRLMRGYF